MREIKFRGKCSQSKRWVYGWLLTNKLGTYIVTEENPHECTHNHYIEIDEYCRVVPESVGQYTGLCDKNGKEIYEGDIVRYTFDNPDSVLATENGLKVRTDKIFWQEWRASFAIGCELTNNDLFRYVRNGNRVEVIGNIHDNPELLEVG